MFFILGILSLPVAGCVASFVEGGKAAVGSFLKRALMIRFPLRWLLPIFLIPLIIPALAIMLYRLLGGVPPDLPVLSQPWLILTTFVFMFLIGGGPEEFGWRGYALDRLQARWSPLVASLILGVIWGVWHTPLFFIRSTAQYYTPYWAFMLLAVSFSILTTWVYNGSGKNFFAAWLFHGAINTGLELFPSIQRLTGGDQRIFIFCVILYLVLTGLVVAAARPRKWISPPGK